MRKNGRSLARKLILLFTLMFLTLSFLQFVTWRYTVNDVITAKSKSMFEELSNQYAKQFKDRILRCMQTSDSIKYNSSIINSVQDILTNELDYETDRINIIIEVIKLLNLNTMNPNTLTSIQLFTVGNNPISVYIQSNKRDSIMNPNEILTDIDPMYLNYVWRSDSTNSYQLSLNTYICNGLNVIGLLTITFNNEVFANIVSDEGQNLDMLVKLESSNNEVLYSSSVGYTTNIDEKSNNNESVIPITWNLQVDTILSNRYLEQEIFQFSKIFFIFAFSIILLFFILTLTVTSSVFIPLKKISIGMENIQKRNFDYQLDFDSYEEYNSLMNRFNFMAREIKQYIATIISQQEQYRELQFVAVNSRFNPHFVYNTLDLIKWELVLSDNTDLSEMIVKFSNLLRYTMSLNIEFAYIERDFIFVENYLKIQHRLSNNKFNYTIEIEEALLRYKIPKMLIQPLLENCIKHGFSVMEKGGLICVKVFSENDAIVILIEDNGKGIPAEKLELFKTQLLHKTLTNMSKEDRSGFGLFLVNSIVKYFYGNYGDNYGISLGSNPEGGLSVFVRIAKYPDLRFLNRKDVLEEGEERNENNSD